MNKWTIEKAKLSDASAIAQFQVEMAMESENTVLDHALVLQGVTLGLQDEAKGTYIVARADDSLPIGSLLLTREWSDWKSTWYWWIQSVYVKPDFRRQGVYSSLYSFVKQLASEQSVHTIRLYVDRDNEKGLNTYTNLGMHESHYLLFEEDI